MKVEEFLNARLDEMETIVEGSNILGHIQNLIDFNREIIEEFKKWPIMLEGEPFYDQTYDPDKPDELRFALLQKVEWATRETYFERFGREAPTTPFIQIMLRAYRNHPDFNPAWLS